MNPALLFMIAPVSMKRLVYVVLASLILITALPAGAVLAFTNIALLSSGDGGPPTGQNIYTEPATFGDTYDYGYCTYWAALRRIQIGDPIPNNWGNAITWNINAELAGYVVNHTPSFGAIFQWPQAPGGEGHVAFVESVNPKTGSWTISEMNAVGWDVVDERTYPKAAALFYNFIHNRHSGSAAKLIT